MLFTNILFFYEFHYKSFSFKFIFIQQLKLLNLQDLCANCLKKKKTIKFLWTKDTNPFGSQSIIIYIFYGIRYGFWSIDTRVYRIHFITIIIYIGKPAFLFACLSFIFSFISNTPVYWKNFVISYSRTEKFLSFTTGALIPIVKIT